MSIELRNPDNAPLTGIEFTDTMPAGMIIANPPNFNTGTCGGTLSGAVGDSTITFSGGSLSAATTCTMTMSVTMVTNGNLTNTIPIGAVTTFNGVSNTQPAEASLTNLPGASVSKYFSPNSIPAGLDQHSVLTITIRNTSTFALTSMGLVDTLPAGLLVAGSPAPVNNCGGTLTAVTGTQSIVLGRGTLRRKRHLYIGSGCKWHPARQLHQHNSFWKLDGCTRSHKYGAGFGYIDADRGTCPKCDQNQHL